MVAAGQLEGTLLPPPLHRAALGAWLVAAKGQLEVTLPPPPPNRVALGPWAVVVKGQLVSATAAAATDGAAVAMKVAGKLVEGFTLLGRHCRLTREDCLM